MIAAADLRGHLESIDGVELLPPAAEAKLAAFETNYGVSLPAEYRRFVKDVCDGITMYEEPTLYSLDEVALVLAQDDVDPSAPFIYDADEAAAIRAALGAPRQTSLLTDPAFLRTQKFGPTHGCLILSEAGGDVRNGLVVAGDERGWMWRLGQVDTPESLAHYGLGAGPARFAPLSFGAWFPHWARDALGASLGATG